MALTQVSTNGIRDGQVHTADIASAQITYDKFEATALDHRYTLGVSGSDHFTFQGEGLTGTVNDPTLYLTRGKTYRFALSYGSGSHPFRIQSTTGTSGTEYNTGVTNNGGAGGSTVIFEVPHDAPDVLYYQCTSHAAMNGIFYVTGALADGTVTTAKLGADAVTEANIANDAVRMEHILADNVTSSEIASNAVTTAKIADQAVTLAKLPHGDGSSDGKFLRANDGADPTFETIDLTALSASNLTSGTVPDARFPATLPAVSAANLTNVPAANITGTLPAISGANLTNLPGGGKIIQVKQAFKSSSFSSNAHLGTYADITGLSLDMQVASNTSKILFLGTICYQYPHDDARGITFKLLNGSTSIGDSTAYATLKGIQSANYNFNDSHANQGLYMLSFGYLYTPGDTNNNTYKMQATGLNTSANTSWYWRINEMGSAYGNGGTSHLTAMEVAP